MTCVYNVYITNASVTLILTFDKSYGVLKEKAIKTNNLKKLSNWKCDKVSCYEILILLNGLCTGRDRNGYYENIVASS